MADHNLPLLSSTYTDFLNRINDRLDDLAVGLNPSATSTEVTNQPDNSVRWNSSLSKWQRWDATLATPAWVDQASSYAISISGTAANASALGGLSLAGTGNGPVWGTVPRIHTDGVTEVGRYLDFHNTSSSGVTYNVRLDTNNTATDLFITPQGGSATKIITVAGLSAVAVDLSTTQTVGGTKTFSNSIVANITGNAATATNASTVTDGVYLTTTQTVSNKTIQGLKEVRVAIPANAIDINTGNFFTKTISVNTTFTVSNVPTSGIAASFVLELTNAGAYTITWWTSIKWASGTAPTLTASGRDVLGFYTHDGGTTWTGLVLGKDVK